MRRRLAEEPFEEKLRKVGALLDLSAKFKMRRERETGEAALLESLDKAAAELDAGKGIPIERVRADIRQWAKKSNK